MNMTAVAWSIAGTLILAAAVRCTRARHREEAAWLKWMRDTDQAIDVASGPARDFERWENSMTGGRR